MDWHWFVQTSGFKGAVSGFLSAAVVDFHAMSKFNGWTDFAAYNWSVATFRWAMGIVTGALSGMGLGAMVG
jgi:hypothetical protein